MRPRNFSAQKDRIIVKEGTQYQGKKVIVRAISPFAPPSLNLNTKFPRIHHLIQEVNETKEEFEIQIQQELNNAKNYIQQIVRTEFSPHQIPENSLKRPKNTAGDIQLRTENISLYDTQSFIQQRSISPGPSHYKPECSIVYANTSKARIGSQNRDRSTYGTLENIPGPADYGLVDVNLVRQKTTFGFQFPQEERMLLKKSQTNQDLGPGAYNVVPEKEPKIQVYHQIAFPRGQRIPLESQQQVPGVGQYDLMNNRQKRTPAYSIGNGDRFQNFDKKVPGVGDYDIGRFRAISTPKATITTDTRFQYQNKLSSPPLTKYNIQRGFDVYLKQKVNQQMKAAFRRSNSPRVNDDNQYLRRMRLRKQSPPIEDSPRF